MIGSPILPPPLEEDLSNAMTQLLGKLNEKPSEEMKGSVVTFAAMAGRFVVVAMIARRDAVIDRLSRWRRCVVGGWVVCGSLGGKVWDLIATNRRLFDDA